MSVATKPSSSVTSINVPQNRETQGHPPGNADPVLYLGGQNEEEIL